MKINSHRHETSLVVQWLRGHAANSGARVLFLVRELRFHILFSATKRFLKINKIKACGGVKNVFFKSNRYAHNSDVYRTAYIHTLKLPVAKIAHCLPIIIFSCFQIIEQTKEKTEWMNKQKKRLLYPALLAS